MNAWFLNDRTAVKAIYKEIVLPYSPLQIISIGKMVLLTFSHIIKFPLLLSI